MATKLTPKQKAQLDELSMSEKIAILLIQVGEDTTGEILRHLDIDSITEISKQIVQLNGTDKQIGAAVLEEFFAIFQSNQ
ncbi:flagellar motor switch protein FliG, partial [Helicobacter pylori]|nr:flagellar motor switch protein FliG [Helicobacter pylori]